MSQLNVVLYRPEIAGNTGNIIRLCSNTGIGLHLIKPLGYELDDTRLKRAGLDYHEYADVCVHDSLADCMDSLDHPHVFAFSARAPQSYFRENVQPGAALLFGPESTGLDPSVLSEIRHATLVRIPMVATSRSLNLSNAVAVAAYEGLRQLGFPLVE